VEETKWWSKFCLVSAVLALVLLLAGPLGYKYGIAELMPSFAALILALVMGLLVLVAGLVLLVVAARKNLRQDRNLLLVAVLLCLLSPWRRRFSKLGRSQRSMILRPILLSRRCLMWL
jgi:hypothetical protein